jgi:hypothetical protein
MSQQEIVVDVARYEQGTFVVAIGYTRNFSTINM